MAGYAYIESVVYIREEPHGVGLENRFRRGWPTDRSITRTMILSPVVACMDWPSRAAERFAMAVGWIYSDGKRLAVVSLVLFALLIYFNSL
ncbi:hypothetical protein [Natrinema versiforme]|uniref:Uncharacterized protein n=2 Tax=root TaxID=1 RepID=A0A4P8WRH5_9EURY|nr:hypothetical protein [Natrinema versiforme]YP_010772677.1 hypothetical protein QIT49_gp10 [Natrinema versiforme icosahedral virus 1]QCS45123.1 hypothetical protein FEJ81_22920 [Natrinema versiforme]DAC85261.1 TPA_asm: hypothetical protein NVIV1gp22 [Natrinema versiforme icosahedral virus 1]